MATTKKSIKLFHAPTRCFLIVLVCLLTVSCNDNRVLDNYKGLYESTWTRHDTISFDTKVTGNQSQYYQQLSLRMTDDYPFTTLTVQVEQKVYETKKDRYMPARTIRRTYRLPVTDDDGNILGTGLDVYQLSFEIVPILLSEGDSVHTDIYHQMRTYALKGISDIGLTIYKH